MRTRRWNRGRRGEHIAVAVGVLFCLLWMSTIAGCGGGASPHTAVVATSSTTAAAPSGPSYTVVTTAPVRPGGSGPVTATSTPPISNPGDGSTTHVPGASTITSSNPTNTGITSTTSGTTTTTKQVALTVSGPSGTRQFSMAELKGLSETTGYGGWKNQLGNITAPRPYRGVAMGLLMGLVGGGTSAVVTASDGYQQTLTSAELEGAVIIYDPSTGDLVSAIAGGVSIILAYELNGAPLSSGEGGPLRIAFVSPQNDQVTDSNLWVKYVSSIEVR